ncbi:MAG: endolytic transglycosylase MltG [Pseudomonadota bacterium]
MQEPQEETGGEKAPPGEPEKNRWRMLSNPQKWLIAGGGTALLLCLFFVWLFLYAAARPHSAGEDPIVVFIPPGSGFSGVKKALVSSQVISDDIRFSILSRWMRSAGRMKAGEYLFPPESTHRQIIEKLAKGDVYYRPLTVPEGSSINQIADLLSRGFDYDRDLVLQRVRDPDLIKSFGLGVPSLEGYLFPDTYHITRGQSLDAVIAMMVQRFKLVFSEISKAGHSDGFTAQGMSRHELVILASIVEKETALAEERPLIAAVFFNRLKVKMKLQADPTVIYGINDFNGNLTKENLQTPSPYNTYTLPGLPVGPIANPGKESLSAVLHPADTADLYFVANNDGSGSHCFSRSLEEHNRAVQRFQQQRSSGGK